jgi:hypothetical protein
MLVFQDKRHYYWIIGLFVIYMPTIFGAKMISNQSTHLKNIRNLENTRNVELNAGNVVSELSDIFSKELLM